LAALRLAVALAIALAPGLARAHPHVFIDGGVDFLLGPDQRLEALRVTWRYDVFETLYTLAAVGVSPGVDGTLAQEDAALIAATHSIHAADFDGSAHLSIGGAPVVLDAPEALKVDVVDGRLEVSFTRALPAAAPLGGQTIEVGFYESTYFFKFSVTDAPRVEAALGGPATAGPGCAPQVVKFDQDSADPAILAALASLSREEVPKLGNVGAQLADRIVIQCG
jgi:ABC-type uncharacterized transport system substrate-binding protein